MAGTRRRAMTARVAQSEAERVAAPSAEPVTVPTLVPEETHTQRALHVFDLIAAFALPMVVWRLLPNSHTSALVVVAVTLVGAGLAWLGPRGYLAAGVLVTGVVTRWPLLLAAAGAVTAVYAAYRWWGSRPVKAGPTRNIPGHVALWRTAVYQDPRAVLEAGEERAGFFPGAVVSNDVEERTDDEGRVIATTLRVHCTMSAHHVGTIDTLKPRIAHVYLTRPEGITYKSDQHQNAWVTIVPQWKLDADAAAAKVEQEARKARILVKHEWPGPRLDAATGVLTVARTEFGSDAKMPIFVPQEGAKFLWVAGSSGTGKTYFLRNVLASACSKGLVVPHVIDMQKGGSLPEWSDLAASFETTEAGAEKLMRRLDRVADKRERMLAAALGWNVFAMPTPDNPIHLLIVTEAMRLVGNGTFMKGMKNAATTWRKILMAMGWETQAAILDAAFGEAGSTMREQLQFNGSIAMFAAGPETQGKAVGEIEPGLDQRLIPEDRPGAFLLRSLYLKPATLCANPTIRDPRQVALDSYVPVPGWSWASELPDLADGPTEPVQASTSGLPPMFSMPAPDADLGPSLTANDSAVFAVLQSRYPHPISVDALAKEAKCSRQTVYNVLKRHPGKLRKIGGLVAWAG